ncbi:MAG TPA: hypothetical protein VMR54_12285 [Thermoanaerobaculia bacterium]|nr:hypothetical protein [Thermoanaerobaculia bacterium]
MLRITPAPVGMPLSRALLCPNDDTVYDSARWKSCPSCQNEDRVFLSRLLGVGPGNRLPFRSAVRPKLALANQS